MDQNAREILEALQDSPKDKFELAEIISRTPSTAKDHISTLRENGHTVKWSQTERKYHLGEEIHVQADEIPLEDIAQALDGGETVRNLANQFSTDRDTIRGLFHELEEQGYNVEAKDTGEDRLYFLPTEIDKRFSLPESNHYRIGLISDTHLGSDAEHLKELHEYYDRLQDRGITRVFHCGDISDGWKVHTGHLNEIKDEAAGWGNLKEYVIENYPERDSITTHFIEGNHDNKFYNRNNIRFGRLLGNRRPDLHYCGNSQATFNLTDDIDLELIHPSGGKPYTTGYRLQTLYRERNPDERPSIAGVGHLHGSMYAQTEGVHGLYAGAWKGTTTYGKRKGHQAKIGGWILDIDIKDGSIAQIVPQWHGWDERNTSNRYEMQEL
jgi:predicted phosphodiesterase